MNKFQILNKDGVAIAIKELDKEAATFWNKEVDDKYYANPYPELTEDTIEATIQNADNISQNWFDTIGWQIANLEEFTQGWSAVAEQMVQVYLCTGMLDANDRISFVSRELALFYFDMIVKKLQPYIDLINYWREKGYTPVQIKNE